MVGTLTLCSPYGATELSRDTSAKNPLTTLTRPSIERVLSVSDNDILFN